MASFLSTITQTFPTALPVDKHRRELARAVRSIQYAIGPSTAPSVLRHYKNHAGIKELWSHPEEGPLIEAEVSRGANNAYLQSLSAHIEDMTLLDVLDLVGVWKDSLRHLRLDVLTPDPRPEDGADRSSLLQHEGGESLPRGDLLKYRISSYSLKSVHCLEGGAETNLPSLGWIEDLLGKSHSMLHGFCCPTLPASILDGILARHASTLVVLYTNKECLEVVRKYIPAMSALEELYLGGTFDAEVRTLVPFVEAGNLPRLRVLWIETVNGELHRRENLLALGTAMHVEFVVTTTRRWEQRGPTPAGKPYLIWGNSGSEVRVS
jgi:hypothetical protein